MLLLSFSLAFGLIAALAFSLTGGLAAGLAAALAIGLAVGLSVGLSFGLALGLTLGLALGDRVGRPDTHGDAERRDGSGELEGVAPPDTGLFRGLLVPIRHHAPPGCGRTAITRGPNHSMFGGATEKYYPAWP